MTDYYKKKLGDVVADPARQDAHEASWQAKDAAKRAFQEQTLPEAIVSGGTATCPYPACGWRHNLAFLTDGVNECSQQRCGRKFTVKKPPREQQKHAQTSIPKVRIDHNGFVDCPTKDCGAWYSTVDDKIRTGKVKTCIRCDQQFIPT